MTDEFDYWRQLGILPPSTLTGKSVIVVGAGGIGSPSILAIGKMGMPKITIYDDDIVDKHNLPNQLYRIQDVGKLKVLAMQEICKEFTGCAVDPRPRLYTENDRPDTFLISAVHSMEARKAIWRTVRYNIKVPFYVEARMGIEVLKIYSLRPTDPNAVSWYERTLHGDDKAVQAPCTERAIAYTSLIAGGLIANQIKKYIVGEEFERRIIFDIHNLNLVLQ